MSATAVFRLLRLSRYSTLATVLFCCLCLIGFDGAMLFKARQERLSEAGREVINLSASIAQYCQETIETADTALLGLRNEVQNYGSDSPQLASMQQLMFEHLTNLPTLHGLFLFDAHGDWLINTVPGTPAGLNYADRDYFQFHLAHPEDIAVVGRPIQSKADGSWIVTITRRIYRADGRFGGVLDATLSADLFQKFFNGFDIGPSGIITLLDDNGVVFVRKPYAQENVGRNIGANASFQAMAHLPDGELYRYISLFDQSHRLAALHRVGRTSLHVIVARSEADILASWWQGVWINLACLALVIGAALYLGHRVQTGLHARMRAERLYRLLANNSSDAIVCGGLDGYARYVSPALSEMANRPTAMLLGSGWIDATLPDGGKQISCALSSLREDNATTSARFRYPGTDELGRWFEMRAHLAAKRHEFVATIRDITEQKHTEEQLEKLNAELSAISLTDALTGVANRRHFDDMLHKEWNRAMRSASPLCLLMIDIDHFKTFNDQYGHLAGDSCLRDVAQLVQASVLRAGDVVCRYGGEEFAVILPETVAEKAALVATRIMDGLQHLAREHQASPLGIVTVSIGIASSVPPLGGEPSALVLAADTALYRAKHAGRARAEIATQVPLQARPHDEALVEKPEADVASV